MAYETEVILKSILYHLLKAKNLKEAQNNVIAVCDADMVKAIKQQIIEENAAD